MADNKINIRKLEADLWESADLQIMSLTKYDFTEFHFIFLGFVYHCVIDIC